MELADLRHALADPRAWPSGAGVQTETPAEVLETHISLLFFRGGRVYKVKKPVRLPFLDFTTLEQRHHFCLEEVRLNRRLAPDVYHGVVPILRGADGRLRFASGPDDPGAEGEAVVDWAVSMVRLSAHGMLDAHLDAGEVDNELLGRLAALLARFHSAARTGFGVDEHGAPDRVLQNALDNFEALRAYTGPEGEGGFEVLTPRAHAFLEAATRAFVREHNSLLSRRVTEGYIREGHGDLHAGNVHITPGAVRAYDCIEFLDAFRCGDVASDLAFLAMDLDLRGYPAFSRFLVRRYGKLADDVDLPLLINFYKGYRAMVRCKVACITASAAGKHATDERREELRLEARRYANLALGYVLEPGLVLTTGLPGTGKSWVARAIATPLRAALVRSDVRRKVLAGIALDRRTDSGWGQGLYAPELRERTYRSLLETEVRTLLAHRAVVVDAAFPTRSQRSLFLDAAARLGRPFHVVHVTAGEDLVRARLDQRTRDGSDPSDAGWEVHLQAREAYEPPDEVPPAARVDLVSLAEAPEDTAARVLEGMLPRRPAPTRGTRKNGRSGTGKPGFAPLGSPAR